MNLLVYHAMRCNALFLCTRCIQGPVTGLQIYRTSQIPYPLKEKKNLFKQEQSAEMPNAKPFSSTLQYQYIYIKWLLPYKLKRHTVI